MTRWDSLNWNGLEIPVLTVAAAVVGSGAAGFSAACALHEHGVTDAVLLSEGVNSGTSRNAGSDKQTFYKLSLAGDQPDSVGEMAATLFAGGGMDGDTALIDAAFSAGNFYRLAALGVPFPHNDFGEYAGYKTDHDPRQRATSAGPLTSRFMTEALQADAARRGVPVLDGLLAVAIVTGEDGRTMGLLALDRKRQHEPNRGLTLLRCGNLVWATGGEAGMFQASVFPESQHGALGVALQAGARAANLTEWQHGLASIAFRWNVSGTYQQVLPRYISTGVNGGDQREFLADALGAQKALELTFLKGYQWPFDARKLPGSSVVDVLVAQETARGRRVFLDYRTNPVGLNFDTLPEECRAYLANSGAQFGTPFERLAHMNPDAVALYRSHDIDLAREPLEVAVCAQHQNGGLEVDAHWQTNVPGLYACGEAAGTFGVYRPGGSALNATQTGSRRAAAHIARHGQRLPEDSAFAAAALSLLECKVPPTLNHGAGDADDWRAMLCAARARMSAHGAFLRRHSDLDAAVVTCQKDLERYWDIAPDVPELLPDVFRGWDMLTAQLAVLSAMAFAHGSGFPSRGSALLLDEGGVSLPGLPWKVRAYSDAMIDRVLVTGLKGQGGSWVAENALRPVRPIPQRELWFETVWAWYREERKPAGE